MIDPELYRDVINDDNIDRTARLFTELAVELDVPDDILREAQELFGEGYDSMELIVGVIASIGAAGDMNGHPYNPSTLDNIVDEYTDESYTSVVKGKQRLYANAGIVPEPVSPHDWIRRFATETNPPTEVTDLAHDIIDASESNNAPSVLAAAAIYRAAKHLSMAEYSDHNLTQSEIGGFFDRTPNGIRKVYRDLTVPE